MPRPDWNDRYATGDVPWDTGEPLDYLVEFVRSRPTPPGRALDVGCFHIFDEGDDRARFAEHVAAVLEQEGLWLSLIGSTEGPERDHGPPRRSLRDVVNAVEPSLEIIEIRSTDFRAHPSTRED